MSFTTTISAADLQELLVQNDDSLVVLDCRFSLSDFGQGLTAYRAGHIPSAQYAHLNDDFAGPITATSGRHPLPDFEVFKLKMVTWGINSVRQVVVYDDVSGAMAARAWWMIKHWSGYTNVAVLDGGIKAWLSNGGAIETVNRVPDPEKSEDGVSLDFRQNSSAILEVSEIEQGRFSKLIDARSTARYSGQSEPIDSQAGHIPGAENLPFEGNLDPETGRFLPAELLRQRFQVLKTSGSDTKDCVHMCGSGVTACHNMLAAELAGYHPGMLYVGSWSEWITNPNRPIATTSPTD